jgi:hypothetical protein
MMTVCWVLRARVLSENGTAHTAPEEGENESNGMGAEPSIKMEYAAPDGELRWFTAIPDPESTPFFIKRLPKSRM